MKNVWLNISYFHFSFFKVKIFYEIVTPFVITRVVEPRSNLFFASAGTKFLSKLEPYYFRIAPALAFLQIENWYFAHWGFLLECLDCFSTIIALFVPFSVHTQVQYICKTLCYVSSLDLVFKKLKSTF